MPGGPVVRPRGLARELERARDAAWRNFARHRDACQVCALYRTDPTNVCALGSMLRSHFVDLLDMGATPSVLAEVRVIPPGDGS